MGNTTDVIKGLIMRMNMNEYKAKNKKLANQILSQLQDKFHEVLMEKNDEVFFEDFIKLITSPSSSAYITSNFYPENMEEYAAYKNIYGFSNDFRYELRWMISCILFCKDTINDFVLQREKYDNYVLLNEYEKALTIVDEVQKKYGVSYWVMECRFFLNSKMGRDNNELIEGAPLNVFGSVLNFFELKNRESVTSDEYYYIAEKEISSAKKHLKDCEEAIDFFDFQISGNIFQSEPEKIMHALFVVQQCSLIDRYLFIIKICNELMNQSKTNYFYICMQTYIVLLKDIKDDHLTALRFVFDQEDNRKTDYELKSRLDNAKSSFISGDLIHARAEATQLLNMYPNNTAAMSMLVETNILINDGYKQFENTNLGMLLDRLASVYTLDTYRDDAMEDVGKLALTCSQSTWAQNILSDVLCRCSENKGFDYVHNKILSNLQHLDIETMIASLDKGECVSFITEKLDKNDRYVQFRKAILIENYKLAINLCGIEQIKDYLFICDKNTSTEEKMSHLHSMGEIKSSINIITMKEFLSSVDLKQDSDMVFNIVTNLVIDNIYTCLFIPWEKIITYIDDGPVRLRQNICTPILYYVYAYYIDRDKKDDLGIVCSDFFNLEDIERPSQMKMFEDRYNKKMLVYFLKNVCTAKIMDDAVYVFENTQERDQERVEICNLLTYLDSANEVEYVNEIRELTQKLMINKELKIIDESRIHVNVEGIKERLINAEVSAGRFDNNVKNEFQRYLFYQNERLYQWLRVIKGEEAEKFKETNETAIRLLKELVQKIRDAFVSSDEYGLNGYLSLNIRHNTLEDELRSPLHRTMLYAKKDYAKKTYIISERWTQFVEPEEREILQSAFGVFHLKTEGILAKLKGDYIQIRTELKNERGMFDYRLTEADYSQIAFFTDEVKTFEEFFDKVIAYFWDKTEYNLDNIKNVIRNEITQDYMVAFSDLKNSTSPLKNKTIVRELHQKISEAETYMQNVLEHICHWFQRSNESKHNDFDLQFAFDLGLKTITNMHPETRFVVEQIEETVSDKIPGDYLKSFDGIFYNLFDNIYKRAMPLNNRVYIRYALKNLKGKIRIYIENDFDCTKDISEDIRRVEEAKEIYETETYAEKAKDEGGTGIPKICKIIKYDLRLHPYLDFGYIKDCNKFFIEIKF